jgi:hypothetical protein
MSTVLFCATCSNTISVAGYPATFRRGSEELCGSCGGRLEPKELGEAELQSRRRAHSWWLWRVVLTFEGVFALLFIAAMLLAGIAKGV